MTAKSAELTGRPPGVIWDVFQICGIDKSSEGMEKDEWRKSADWLKVWVGLAESVRIEERTVRAKEMVNFCNSRCLARGPKGALRSSVPKLRSLNRVPAGD